MTPEVFADLSGLDVSRETFLKLATFHDKVVKWSKALNLVSPSTIPDLWQRHIADSAQLLIHAPGTARTWVDIGSGGGFPGAVCAILAEQFGPEMRFTLVESDARKAVFLSEASRSLHLPACIINDRAEVVPPQNADVVSVRALAPLADLLAHIDRHLSRQGSALLMKGAQYRKELDEAALSWTFATEVLPSRHDPDGVILRVREVRHV